MKRKILKWVPWRRAVQQLANAYGFIDPISVFARMRAFSKESEVSYPFELLRSGAIFHARGLINTQAIQHNLDWKWPFWITKQFDPTDEGFLPRAFSITHVNLTHRNWTAIGLPDLVQLPVVDPAGLVTPYFDGWSIEVAAILEDGTLLRPAEAEQISQRLVLEPNLRIETTAEEKNLRLDSRAEVLKTDLGIIIRISATVTGNKSARLIFAIRPYNTEGISFIEEIAELGNHSLQINGDRIVQFSHVPAQFYYSDYESGDLYRLIQDNVQNGTTVKCKVGMASAAAVFNIKASSETINAELPLLATNLKSSQSWPQALERTAQLQIPDSKIKFLFDSAVRTLILHSPDDVYPGPYTYHRFWFRDAAFILKSLLAIHLPERVLRTLKRYPKRQNKNGYFNSQEGEWDSNGEALWIIEEYLAAEGIDLPSEWREMVLHGAEWIVNKRLPESLSELHAGLLPAGFSAEHFGPSDYYYWDDFWGIKGLQVAAEMLGGSYNKRFSVEADKFLRSVEKSIAKTKPHNVNHAIPVSPYRRMDSAAVGSIVAGYPLKLFYPDDKRLASTAEYLFTNSFFEGAFFQEMIHSGINAYLSLHVAQIFLRAGDRRFFDIVEAVAKYASPTGQWPEAIHPRTKGGCMGDGQHAWAAAEWVQILRNMFVDEEGDKLILLKGIPERWLQPGSKLGFGPTCTRFGDVTVKVVVDNDQIEIDWNGSWHKTQPVVELHLSNKINVAKAGESRFVISRGS